MISRLHRAVVALLATLLLAALAAAPGASGAAWECDYDDGADVVASLPADAVVGTTLPTNARMDGERGRPDPRMAIRSSTPRIGASFRAYDHGREVPRCRTRVSAGRSAAKGAPARRQIGPAGNPGAVASHDHHVFPQQFKRFFDQRGIDIDEFTVPLGEGRHLRGAHGRGADGLPGRWNARWRDFIRENPGASAKDVYQFGGRLMDEYGLSGLPIRRYGGGN